MADPTSNPVRKWLWPLLIALLAVLMLVWLFNPAGDDDAQVEDPITTPEFGETDAGVPAAGDTTTLQPPVLEGPAADPAAQPEPIATAGTAAPGE